MTRHSLHSTASCSTPVQNTSHLSLLVQHCRLVREPLAGALLPCWASDVGRMAPREPLAAPQCVHHAGMAHSRHCPLSLLRSSGRVGGPRLRAATLRGASQTSPTSTELCAAQPSSQPAQTAFYAHCLAHVHSPHAHRPKIDERTPCSQDAWDADTFRLADGAEDEVPYALREHWKNESAAALRHAYDNYIVHAAPADDIRPRSCKPSNSQVLPHPRRHFACVYGAAACKRSLPRVPAQ